MSERKNRPVSNELLRRGLTPVAAGALALSLLVSVGKDTARADVIRAKSEVSLTGLAWQVGSVTAGKDRTFRQAFSYNRAQHRLIFKALDSSSTPITQTCGADMSIHYVMDGKEGPITLENQSHPACAYSSTGFGNEVKIKETLDLTRSDQAALKRMQRLGIKMVASAITHTTGGKLLKHTFSL